MNACPTLLELERFVAGRSDEHSGHIAGCSRCAESLSEIRDNNAFLDEMASVFSALPRSERLPESLGRYPIERRLGAGGMGEVFLALDPVLERRIAIKRLFADAASSERRRARFESEARALAAFGHPNIATVHSLEVERDRPFITMEWIDGPPLDAALMARSLGVDEALAIGGQVAGALAAAHRVGVVHRDLKPSNIVLHPERGAIVLDFGLALFTEDRAPEWLTWPARPGTEARRAVVGTPGYMSPEQARGDVVDGRADVFSFGCVLFECLTGALAFGGEDPFERWRRAEESDPDWSLLPSTLPTDVTALLRGSLRKEVDERLRGFDEFRAALLPYAHARERTRLAKRPPRLPRSATSFVGREQDLAALAERVRPGVVVSLVGPGGSGKTRLALEMVHRGVGRFPGGVWFVDLSSIEPSDDDEGVAEACARALGVADRPGRSALESVAEEIGARSLLLLLDNCERCRDGVARVTDALLADCPSLGILATSREELALETERVFRVDPLPVPDSANDLDVRGLRANPTVSLFIDRATMAGVAIHDEAVPMVAQICRRLGGLPLGIELAAARTREGTVADIAARLDDLRELARRRRPTERTDRQCTLETLFDWSYELLDESERRVFRRIAVFRGDFDGEAIEAIVGVGRPEPVSRVVGRLVDRCLVQCRPGDGLRGIRYRLLDPVRVYAQSRWSEGETSEQGEIAERHRRYFSNRVESWTSRLRGPDEAEALRAIDADHADIVEAVRSCRRSGDPEQVRTGLRLVRSLYRYWLLRGHWQEGRRLAEELSTPLPGASVEAAGALECVGLLAQAQCDARASRLAYEHALEMWSALDDPVGHASALHGSAIAALHFGDYDVARIRLHDALEELEPLDRPLAKGHARTSLGVIDLKEGRFDDAARHFAEARVLTSGDRYLGAALDHNEGEVATAARDFERAFALFDRARLENERLGHRAWAAKNAIGASLAALDRGDLGRARRHLLDALELHPGERDPLGLQALCEAAALGRDAGGRLHEAVRLVAASEVQRERLATPLSFARRERVDRAIEKLRGGLGETQFEKAWREGWASTPVEAWAWMTAS
ncbi:MAG: protein kinase [Planctomycetes bacterium]|nr:protein kinase [Planctomycetota bacterium]